MSIMIRIRGSPSNQVERRYFATMIVHSGFAKGCPLESSRTFRSAIAMSALPPKADMCSAQAHVRFGPKADNRKRSR